MAAKTPAEIAKFVADIQALFDQAKTFRVKVQWSPANVEGAQQVEWEGVPRRHKDKRKLYIRWDKIAGADAEPKEYVFPHARAVYHAFSTVDERQDMPHDDEVDEDDEPDDEEEEPSPAQYVFYDPMTWGYYHDAMNGTQSLISRLHIDLGIYQSRSTATQSAFNLLTDWLRVMPDLTDEARALPAMQKLGEHLLQKVREQRSIEVYGLSEKEVKDVLYEAVDPKDEVGKLLHKAGLEKQKAKEKEKPKRAALGVRQKTRQCYVCGDSSHLASKCPKRDFQSRGAGAKKEN